VRPSRETFRHPLIDYSRGTFFVTICAYNRAHLFGNIAGGHMTMSPLGYLLADHWRKIPSHYGNVSLDISVVMPNHLHGVLTQHSRCKDDRPSAKDLGSIIGSFKSGVSRQARQMQILPNGLVFQSRFWDHAIRHERALERVREYIQNNPLQWHLDRENLDRTGENEFYAWLESYSRHIAAMLKPSNE
jgi:putative transposase